VLLVALVAFACVTLWRAGVRERRAEAEFPPEGQVLTVNGRRVHAVVTGTGPDLVLLHGLSGNARDFTFALAPALAARYRVIVFDRPGLGFSDPLPAGADGLADQARHLAQAALLLGARRPVVAGHSYGGSVALAWAVSQPDRIAALVTLAAPSHSWTTPMPLLYRVTSNRLGALVVVPLFTAFVPDSTLDRAVRSTFAPGAVPDNYADHLGAPLTLRRASMRANARHRARLKADIEAMQPLYRRLALPFELVHGTADDTVGFDIHAVPMSREAAGVRVTRLEGQGHMLQHTAQAEVVAAIDRAASRAGLTENLRHSE
jgi:pimeloyl-ACP methyl ester carboxylesterase